MWNRPGVVLSAAAWVSVFSLGWAMAWGLIPAHGFAFGFWCFCVVVAIIASAVTIDRGVVIENRPPESLIAVTVPGMEPDPFPVTVEGPEEQEED